MPAATHATIHTVARPYLLTFASTGQTYPISSGDAQRLIDGYPAITATRTRVVLRADDETACILQAATRGGGPAFLMSAT